MNEGKRVLFLTSNFPRWEGDSTTPFVLHLAQDLADTGWQVDVLAPHAPGAVQREHFGNVGVDRFRYFWPAQGETVCYGGGALENLRRRPSALLKVPLLVGSEAASAIKRARSGAYSIIHSHWILPQGFAGTPAARLTGIPHVVTVHGGDIFDLRGRGLDLIKRLVLEHADAVTFNSGATECAARAVAPAMGLVRRIPMGVSIPAPPRREVERIRSSFRQGSGPLLVFLGRLVEEKGYEDFLRSVDLISAQAPDCTALVCGEGQHRADAESLADALGIKDRVTFTGWIDHAEVPAWLQAADVVVFPSRTGRGGWVEAQGLAIIEAMAAGAAVVATRTGGVPDTVTDGENGLLVPERDPVGLGWAVLELHRDAGLRLRLAKTAAESVTERFSRKGSAAAFSELYEELLSGRLAPGSAAPASRPIAQYATKLVRNPVAMTGRFVKKKVIEPRRYRSGSGYEAERYWEERFERHGNNLRAVGDEGKTVDENSREYETAKRVFTEALAAVLGDEKMGRVLEVGVGTGAYSDLILEHEPEAYVGIDITDVFFADLAKRHHGIALERHDVTQSVPAGPFDLIVILDVILHIVEPDALRAALQNLESQAAPGAHILLAPTYRRGRKHLYYVRHWTTSQVLSFFRSVRLSRSTPFRTGYLLDLVVESSR